MKKILFIITLTMFAFSTILAENKLESASFIITNLDDIAKVENVNQNAKISFVLQNKSTKDVNVVMNLKKISMTDGHAAEFCFGENCMIYDGSIPETNTEPFVLKAGAATDPMYESYIKMQPYGVEGKDTLLVTIYNNDNKDNDFVQFNAIWDFSNGSINISNSNLKIYPQPVTNILHIISTSDNTIETVEFFDLSGKFIYKANVSNDTNIFTVNTEFLPSGVFIAYLTSNGKKTTTFKVVK
ncbi:MAG: T9SS type A sorting domain-containing protein [Ignavibacteria bacterium]|jgi:hypothetical protein|nr:T9SS type A sorting domain-containing protein [Ignavibacteria bacterium]